MAQCKCGVINEYREEPYVCRDCRDKMPDVFNEGGVSVLASVDNDYVLLPGDYLVGRDMPVRGSCAPWEPDAAAVAAKEREILDFVVSGQVSEFDRSSMSKLRTLQDELLTLRTDPDEIQEALDLWDEIKSLRVELETRMKNMPHAIRNKVYGL